MRSLLSAGAWLGKSAVVILAVIVLNFFLIRLAPGNPAMVLAGEAGASDPQVIAQIKHEYGLDKPVLEQLGVYLAHIGHLNLGYSYRDQRPVLRMILERVPATLLLTGVAFLFALTFGIAIGAFAARRSGQWADRLIGVVGLAFYAMPTFWVGLVLVLIFSAALGWLPPFGMHAMIAPKGGIANFGDLLAHLVLPAATLGLFYFAIYARLTRAAVLDVQNQEYVLTAEAKGLPPRRILTAHILRNALLSVITVAGMQAGQLIGGAVVVETVFAWPGIGRLAFEAVLQRDYNVLLGVFLTCAVMVVLFNLFTDILLRMIDPRIAAQ